MRPIASRISFRRFVGGIATYRGAFDALEAYATVAVRFDSGPPEA
jgi:hypothetical protein